MSTNGTNGANDSNETLGSDPGVSTDGRPEDDRKLLATAGTEARRASFGPGGGLGMPAERSDKFGFSQRNATLAGNAICRHTILGQRHGFAVKR